MSDYDKAHRDGWCECLGAIRASLRNYPLGGGDVEVMKQVDRIKEAAYKKGLVDGEYRKEDNDLDDYYDTEIY